MTKPKHSFFKLTNDSFKLLSLTQRRGALRSVIFSTSQALLEVISVAAVIPLFYLIVSGNTNGYSSFFLKGAILHSTLFSWTSVLVTIIIVFALKNCISFFLTHYQSQFIKDVSVSFSKRLFERFYKQSWSDYLKDNSSEAVRKIKTTPSDFANYVLYNFLLLTTDLCTCTFMIGGMLLFDYKIIVIVSAICLPVSILYYFLRKGVISKINMSFRKLTPQASIVLSQGIDSFAEARIYKRENFFINRFMEIREITAKHLANLTAVATLPIRLFEFASVLSFAGVIAYAKTYQADHNNLMVLLGLLSIAMYRIIPAFSRILMSLSQIQAFSYSVTELKESFSSCMESDSDYQPITLTSHIKIQDVSYQYKGASDFQLKNINITISKGDFIVLEGPSGSGKTTFIHILAGLIQDYTGNIMIDDKFLPKLTFIDWRSKLGFTPQYSVVLQDTLLNNIAFGEIPDKINLERIKAVLELTQLAEFVNQLPLRIDTPIGENGLTLSGGQRQRLILARALYQNPDVLLMDEVTNQLDEDNKIAILETLKMLSEKGATIVLASHDHAARKFANRIIHFENKMIQEIQTTLIS